MKKTRKIKKTYEFPVSELAVAIKARQTFTIEELRIYSDKKKKVRK